MSARYEQEQAELTLEVMRHREPLLFDRLPAPDAIAWLAGYSGLGRL